MEVKEFYDNISHEYEQRRYGGEYQKIVADLENAYVKEYIECGNCLEVGCGTGRTTRELVKIAEKVVAVDISSKMLKKIEAEKTGNLILVNKSVYDLAGIEGYGNFDTVICLRMLSHLDYPYEALNVLSKSVKKSGLIIFDLWNNLGYRSILKRIGLKSSAVYTSYMSIRNMKKMIEAADIEVLNYRGFGYPPLKPFMLLEKSNALNCFAQRIIWVCRTR